MANHEALECKQAVPIAKLETTTEQIGKTLEKLSTVLEKLAEQGIEVVTLKENQDVLFERLRKVELNLAQITGAALFASALVSALTALLVKLFTK